MSRTHCVLFVALPYATADLHIGRLIGTFIPADIYRNYLQTFQNKRAVILSGIDSYGTGVYLESLKLQTRPETYVKSKKKQFLEVLKELGIQLRYDFRTDTRSHRKYVNTYVKTLQDNNLIRVGSTKVYWCNKCDKALYDRLLVTATGDNYQKIYERDSSELNQDFLCYFCKEKTVIKQKPALYLCYKDLESITRFNSKETTKEITRYFTEWGLKVSKNLQDAMSSSTHLVYYVWIEALLSYMEMYQRYQKRHNIQNFYYFYGKDNEYYHKGILSQMTLESLESKDSNTFMRNYILDRNSQKQSSSSYNFLNLKDLKGNREVLRFVLASFDTLARDVCVDKESIELRVHTFFNKFINLYNRVIGILKKQKVTIQKSTQKYWDFKYYKSLMRSNTLKQTIDYLYNIQKILSNDIDTLIRSKNMSESQINMICHKCLEIFLYLKPFTPKISSYVLGNMRRLKSLSYNKVTLDFTELL